MAAKKIFIAVVTTLSFFILYLFLPALLIDQRPGPKSPNSSVSSPLNQQNPVNITLKPPHSGLNSVSFLLKNPAILNRDQLTITISQNNQVVRQQSFNGQNIGDPSWLTYKFEPINNQNSLSVKLTTQNTTNNSLYFYGNHQTPVYKTTFSPNLKTSFALVAQSLVDRLTSQPLWPKIIYFLLIITLVLVY